MAERDEMLRAAREVGRYWASTRKRVDKTCPVCGVKFSGLLNQIYDTNRCAKRAAKTRAREKQGKK